ncbi:DUF134 domain-containing protein [Pseudoflavonifractor intestinihominis]|uniref:UPF0251 protein WMO64_03630 n=1 Tax=Pseudoflavonifractor intestinihominis TaxID=3133171 RepID=A0ABV1E7Y6_9FIRM|nr:DUF134 domain-containing protein [uncultured Pseudoflavonifractor sp.]
MPRPQKCRRVCQLPGWAGFAPVGEQPGPEEPVVLTVDEFEVIRLLDLEGLTQEACAEQMEIARTTVTGICDSARRKLADALVNGKRLVIAGGNYRLCDGPGCCHRRGGCRKKQCFGGENR